MEKLPVCILLLAILLVSPAALIATTSDSNSSGNSSGAKATPLLIKYFYSSSLSDPAGGQRSPYCNIGPDVGVPVFDIMCYTPQDLKAAYNFPPGVGPFGLDGAGQTIVIVDAFGSPTVQSDLNTFDAEFGLPPTTIQIVCQYKVCPTVNLSDPDQAGWTGEIDLDTQYAHAMAPGAHIVLFVAQTDDDLTLEKAVQSAVTMFPHSIISQSFGDPELDMLLHTCFQFTDNPSGTCDAAYVRQVLAVGEAAYQQAAREGTTVFASAGDWGADNSGLCVEYDISPCLFTSANPAYPSSSPWVTAVGGTMGYPYYLGSIPTCTGITCSTGLVTFLNTPSCQLNTETPTSTASCIPVGYGGEQVWNEPFIDAATGGAPSLIFKAPSYQSGLGLTWRATPDVSYNAAVDGGILVYFGSEAPTGFYIVGGTSAGSPQWAAIAALADQLAAKTHQGSIGFVNPALYQIGNTPSLYNRDFHDITVGNNVIVTSPDSVGFSAQRGWDDASGWGTPNVANLVPDLVFLSSHS